MKYTPKKNNKTNFAVSLAILALFLLSVILVRYFKLPDSIWQSVFFLCSVAQIELTTKFFIPVYTYYIDKGSFVIEKTMGKKTILECNIDIDSIVALYSGDEFKAQASHNVKNIYNYNTNFITGSSKIIVFEYNNFCEAVKFEPNGEFADTIDALIKNR